MRNTRLQDDHRKICKGIALGLTDEAIAACLKMPSALVETQGVIIRRLTQTRSRLEMALFYVRYCQSKGELYRWLLSAEADLYRNVFRVASRDRTLEALEWWVREPNLSASAIGRLMADPEPVESATITNWLQRVYKLAGITGRRYNQRVMVVTRYYMLRHELLEPDPDD